MIVWSAPLTKLGRLVDRVDGERDRGQVAVQGAVAGLVSEAVAADIILVGRVAEGAVGVEGQAAVRGAGDDGGGEGLAVGVRVVAQHADGGRRGDVLDLAEQGRRRALAVLLESGIEGDHLAGWAVGRLDDGEVARQGVAAAALAGNVESRLIRGLERVAHRVAVVAGDQDGVARGLEIDIPPDVGVDVLVGEADVVVVGRVVGVERTRGGRVAVVRALTDVVTGLAGHGQGRRRTRRWRDGQRAVLVDREGVVDGDRRPVHVVDRDRDRGRVGGQPALGIVVGEAVRTVEVGEGRVGEGAVGVQGQGAVRDAADQGGGKGITGGRRVVGQDAGRRDRERGIFVDGIGVVGRHRRDGVHRERDRGDVAVEAAVVGAEGEAVAAGVIGVRRVDEGAAGVERQRPVERTRAGRAGVEDRGERITVGIAGVGQNAGGLDREAAVLGQGVTVVDGHRRLIDVVDRDGDGRGTAGRVAVGRLVGEAVAAVEVGGRRVGEGAVAGELEGAVSGGGHEHGGQRVLVGVGVVGQHAGGRHAEHGVLVDRIAVVAGRRRRGGNGEGDRGGVAVTGAIVGLVGEAVGAEEAGVGRVGEGAVAVERDRTVGRAAELDGRERGPGRVGVVGQHPGDRGDGEGHVLAGRVGVVVRHRTRGVLHRYRVGAGDQRGVGIAFEVAGHLVGLVADRHDAAVGLDGEVLALGAKVGRGQAAEDAPAGLYDATTVREVLVVVP